MMFFFCKDAYVMRVIRVFMPVKRSMIDGINYYHMIVFSYQNEPYAFFMI